MFAFAINSVTTFYEIQRYCEGIVKMKKPNDVPMLLIGLKMDLKEERQV